MPVRWQSVSSAVDAILTVRCSSSAKVPREKTRCLPLAMSSIPAMPRASPRRALASISSSSATRSWSTFFFVSSAITRPIACTRISINFKVLSSRL